MLDAFVRALDKINPWISVFRGFEVLGNYFMGKFDCHFQKFKEMFFSRKMGEIRETEVKITNDT